MGLAVAVGERRLEQTVWQVDIAGGLGSADFSLAGTGLVAALGRG